MPECRTKKENITITSADVGYGCTQPDAMKAFFKNVLARIDADRKCTGCDCSHGKQCVAELISKSMELELHYDPVALAWCDGAGWKCFLIDEGDHAKDYDARCTCAPSAP
jgi:hypothetical protein